MYILTYFTILLVQSESQWDNHNPLFNNFIVKGAFWPDFRQKKRFDGAWSREFFQLINGLGLRPYRVPNNFRLFQEEDSARIITIRSNKTRMG